MNALLAVKVTVARTSRCWRPIVVLFALSFGPFDVLACTQVEYEKDFTVAIEAVSQWEMRSGIVLGIQARQAILGEFCVSAKELTTEMNLAKNDIDKVSAKVITEYFDRLVDRSKVGRSMGAILRGAYGAQGFSRPQVKRWGRLKVSYTRQVDSLYVGEERFGPVREVLLPIGKAVLACLRGKDVVCRGEVEISTIEDAHFTCN